jgi:hypothetical protein
VNSMLLKEAHSKVECDLLALLFRGSVEAGLLVGIELVSQSGSSDIGDQAGEEPSDNRW